MSRVGQGSGMSRQAVPALAPWLVALGTTRVLAQRPPGPFRKAIRIGPTVPQSILVRADRVIE